MQRFAAILILTVSFAPLIRGQAITRTTDGFDQPVAPPGGEGFYKSRGFRSGGHLGEDWLSSDGNSSKSLGKPVYSIGSGIVVLARDVHVDWGNIVIVRHAWIEQRRLCFADSLYAHLDRISVREGQQVRRGQLLGTIGTNHGMYPAHLHFEIHKDLTIGVNHSAAPRDLRSYWVPGSFIAARRHLDGGGRNVPVPAANFILPNPSNWFRHRAPRHVQGKTGHGKPSRPSGTYRVNRYSDP